MKKCERNPLSSCMGSAKGAVRLIDGLAGCERKVKR